MAHLTKYTYSKLCSTLAIKDEITLEFFLKYIYDDAEIYYMLNKFQLKYLFNYKAILQDENKFYLEFYDVVPERVDTKKFVFERAGKLKYHLNADCKMISKDFADFNIPADIKELGDEAIEDYRNWFKSKGYAESYYNNTLDITKVVFAYNSVFPAKYGIAPLNEKYLLVERIANSYFKHIEDEFNFEEFTTKINHLKNLYNNLFTSPTTRRLSKFDHLANKEDEIIEDTIVNIFSEQFVENYSLLKIREKLRESRNLKHDLIKLLVDFFKWNFKLKEKDFNNITLENFGLQCCGHCRTENNTTPVASL